MLVFEFLEHGFWGCGVGLTVGVNIRILGGHDCWAICNSEYFLIVFRLVLQLMISV